jgi:flagellar motility protein MotE (MotC chaperone)
MSKKLIIMIAAAGLISFTGAFVFAWLTKTAPVDQSDELNQPTVADTDSVGKPWLPQPEAGTMSTVVPTGSTIRQAMTEKRLKNLVFEMREKIQEYNNKLQAFELQEQRLQITRDALKKDIENLNNLQIELASTVAGLKEQRDKLLKTRVDIDNAEKTNLISIAATYDKMDSASAGKILTSMCTKQAQSADVGGTGSGLNDAVKILYYMTERTKAKVLAELVTSEPQLASLLCRRLKQISEI